MSKQVDEAMAKIKLWQEEAKLVMMIVGAISSVAVFVTKFFSGGFKSEPVKLMEMAGSGAGGGGLMESRAPLMAMASSRTPFDWVLWISGVLALTLVPIAVILLVRRIRKGRNTIQ